MKHGELLNQQMLFFFQIGWVFKHDLGRKPRSFPFKPSPRGPKGGWSVGTEERPRLHKVLRGAAGAGAEAEGRREGTRRCVPAHRGQRGVL